MRAIYIVMISVFALSLSPQLHAQQEEQAEVPMVCTAMLDYINGESHMAYVECDGEYAGKCLQEIVLEDGKHDWQEVQCK